MRQHTPRDRRERRRHWLKTVLPAVALVAAACAWSGMSSAVAQQPQQQRRSPQEAGVVRRVKPVAAAGRVEAAREIDELVKRALHVACAERELDPQGSAPIDEMQARPSLPLDHAEVLAGAERAERLLPVAKMLAAESLGKLAREYGLKESSAGVRAALARLARVSRIKPDIELRDNASVLYREPRTIRFGTIFLAGLRSDEGMLGVLAHELTHVADGAGGSLSAIFRGVARRGTAAGLRRISPRRGEELTCDLVGALAVRAYIARTPGVETLARRTARALAHNCVEHDHTDQAHLSPRTTMRALLTLDPALAREITGEANNAAAETAPPPAPRRTQRRSAHTITSPRPPRR